MEANNYFSEKICVVTGAASGIGLAVSEALLEAGAVVLMADLDTERLTSVVARLHSFAGKVQAAAADVTDQGQVKKLLEDAASGHGRLDLVFNNAGVGCTMPIASATLDDWRRLIDLNLWSVIYGIDAALPIMRRQGGGHIVNTASIAGIVPIPYQAIYAATKYAIVGLSESLRFELENDNIYFSVVCPGNVATRIFGKEPPKDAIPAEAAARTILAGVAAKAGLIVFPEPVRQLWLEYCTNPEAAEVILRDLARQRRQSFQSTGSYY